MHKLLRAAVVACSLFAFGLLANSAFAATRFASPNGTAPVETQCTDVTLPCSLDTALQTAQDQDTISLANGTYDVTPKAPPQIVLHWVATDPQTRPVIRSKAAQPTLSVAGSAQSGTTFDHLEIDNLDPNLISRENEGPSAILVGPGVSATVRNSVISGPVCVDARNAGKLEIDDSTLNATLAESCLTLNKDSTVRRSTVGRVLLPPAMILPAATSRGLAVEPGPTLVTAGLVEDTTVNEGLVLSAPTSVARRVRSIVTGSGPAIAGQGLVVDSLADANGEVGAGIVAESQNGGTLVVLGSTAISGSSPALQSNLVEAREPTTVNDLVVSNTIARGRIADVFANPIMGACPMDAFCSSGVIHIDHSDFITRSPAASEQDGDAITEGAGNISGDPRFVDAAHNDFHLSPGSPAIDAGAVQDRAQPSDLDGRPRVQGLAPDLGAFETAGPAGPGAGPAGAHGPSGGSVPKLSRLGISPRRFHIGKRAMIAFSLDTSSSVTLTFQRLAHHRFRTVGHLTVKNGHAGKNTVRFPKRLGGKKLKPGSYKLIALPAHGTALSLRLTLLR